MIGRNPCSDNNGGCNQLCFAFNQTNWRCGCSRGYELKSADGLNCVGMNSFLLFSTPSSIKSVSLKPGYPPALNAVGGFRKCFAVDILHNSSLIFFADEQRRVIGVVNKDMTIRRNIITSGLQKPRGLAVDWVAGNLFWTDLGKNVIEVSEQTFVRKISLL